MIPVAFCVCDYQQSYRCGKLVIFVYVITDKATAVVSLSMNMQLLQHFL